MIILPPPRISNAGGFLDSDAIDVERMQQRRFVAIHIGAYLTKGFLVQMERYLERGVVTPEADAALRRIVISACVRKMEGHQCSGKPGKPRGDDRTVISGILHVLKTGCRWRDVPPAYGPPTTIYNRYNRWSQRRVWQRIFEKMAAVDSFNVRRSFRSPDMGKVDVTKWTLKAQAVQPQLVEVSAARNEDDIFASCGESCTEIAA